MPTTPPITELQSLALDSLLETLSQAQQMIDAQAQFIALLQRQLEQARQLSAQRDALDRLEAMVGPE